MNISYDNPHAHAFNDNYEWIDKVYHYAYCNCGFKMKTDHIISGPSNSNGEWNCLLCHGIANIGFIQSFSINTVSTTTLYPNGVLLLPREDYDKFLNNTIIFPQSYFDYWEAI